MTSTKYPYLEETRPRLTAYEAEINRLIAEAEAAQVEARPGQEDIMGEIRSRFDTVSAQLRELEDSSDGSTFGELKASV